MALEGTLQDFGIPDIFQLIGHQNKTGVLTLEKDEEVVTVSFQDGQIVWADSLNKKVEDMLGTVLVKSGKLTEEELQEALEIQKETLQRMGYVLVNNGFIEKEDLREALNVQVTQIIYKLFRWNEGEYKFKQQDQVDYDKENFTPIEVDSILMEGMRMVDEWPIIERKIDSYDMIFKKSEVVTGEIQEEQAKEDEEELTDLFDDLESESGEKEAAEDISLSDQEKKVFKHINGENTVQDIIDRVHLKEFDVCRSLYDLLERDIIEEVIEEEPSLEETAEDTTTPSREMEIPETLVRILSVIGIVVLVVSGLSSWKNPVSFYQTAVNYLPLKNDIGLNISKNRLQKIDFGLQVYYLNYGKLPDNLSKLEARRIVGKENLYDPWGRRYVYKLREESYLIHGYTPDGKKSKDLVIYRNINSLKPMNTP